jgi:preprotein translocase subunit YajC
LQFYAKGIGSGSGWLMLVLFSASFYFYVRFKKARRDMMQQGKR